MNGSWIYFVGCEGFVKIGTTNNVKARLSALRTGSPFPVGLLGLIPGGAADEAGIHALFKAGRVRGEWFRLTEDELIGTLLACDYSVLDLSSRARRSTMVSELRGTG